MAAARKARELGEALVNVGDNVNEARRLINKGADVNYVVKWMVEGMERSTTLCFKQLSMAIQASCQC